MVGTHVMLFAILLLVILMLKQPLTIFRVNWIWKQKHMYSCSIFNNAFCHAERSLPHYGLRMDYCDSQDFKKAFNFPTYHQGLLQLIDRRFNCNKLYFQSILLLTTLWSIMIIMHTIWFVFPFQNSVAGMMSQNLKSFSLKVSVTQAISFRLLASL